MIPTEAARAEMTAKLGAWSCECRPSDVGLCEHCHLVVEFAELAPALFEAIDIATHALKQVPTNLHTYRCAMKVGDDDDTCTCHCKTVKAALAKLQGEPG